MTLGLTHAELRRRALAATQLMEMNRPEALALCDAYDKAEAQVDALTLAIGVAPVGAAIAEVINLKTENARLRAGLSDDS